MAFDIDNDDWLGDIPLSRKAFIEDVDVMWAPRWTRAWNMQMENIDWYMERCNEVIAKCLEEFNKLWRILTIRNRRKPRAMRRMGSANRRRQALFKMVYKRVKPLFSAAVKEHHRIYMLFNGVWDTRVYFPEIVYHN